MEKNELVVKHNSLIRSRYDYSLAELRLVITVASMIAPEDEDFKQYILPAKEYAELMGADSHNTRKAVKQLGEMLMSKPLHIPREGGGFALANWFSWYEYKDGLIHCEFHPKLRPYMLQLKEQFTKYKLVNILRFKSAYSIRIYELAKSWEGKGEFTISVDEFREILGVKDKYKLYNDFKRYIIERSFKEINSLSDIRLSYREKKLGRKVTDLVITIGKTVPKEKNYLSSRKAFIKYMRENYINADIVSTTDKYTGERLLLSIAPDGTIYDKLGKSFTAERANEMWTVLYEYAKQGKLPILNQAPLIDHDTPTISTGAKQEPSKRELWANKQAIEQKHHLKQIIDNHIKQTIKQNGFDLSDIDDDDLLANGIKRVEVVLPPKLQTPSSTTTTLLMFDDDEKNREVLTMYFADEGIEQNNEIIDAVIVG